MLAAQPRQQRAKRTRPISMPFGDEYLRLSYHGFRAKDKSFNADFKLVADEKLPKIEVVPQDIGRVLLNLINNAFYACAERSRSAVNEKVKHNENSFPPNGCCRYKSINGKQVEISVKDNGNGIPAGNKRKNLSAFFHDQSPPDREQALD